MLYAGTTLQDVKKMEYKDYFGRAVVWEEPRVRVKTDTEYENEIIQIIREKNLSDEFENYSSEIKENLASVYGVGSTKYGMFSKPLCLAVGFLEENGIALPKWVVEIRDPKYPLDKASFYEAVRQVEKILITCPFEPSHPSFYESVRRDPKICLCDYCKTSSECPHKRMGVE